MLAQMLGENLEGDDALQVLVLRLVDDSHAAAAQLGEDPVASDGSGVWLCLRHQSPLPWAHPKHQA